MFKSCESLKALDISNFFANVVTSMESMLSECYSLENFSSLNFSNQKKSINMKNMFEHCQALKILDITLSKQISFDVKNMLEGCYSLKEVNISNYNNLISFNKIFGNFNKKNIKINLN